MPKTLKTALILLALLASSIQSLRAVPPPDDKPYVLVVYADWCPSCQQLKPTLALLNEKYSGKIHFVRFDITSERTAARSKDQAEKLGLSDFYDKNHDRTSVVIILDSSRHEIFRSVNDYAPDHYETVLNQQVHTASR
jgi:thiol-disulfide isomerase/thioredoxin